MAESVQAKALRDPPEVIAAEYDRMVTRAGELHAEALRGLRNLKALLGTDSPEVRGWAPAVQQAAQRAVNAAIRALAAGKPLYTVWASGRSHQGGLTTAMHALYKRGLITSDHKLTDAGRVAAGADSSGGGQREGGDV